MNGKPPNRLDMSFGEALARLARVPRDAIADKDGRDKAGKPDGKPAVDKKSKGKRK